MPEATVLAFKNNKNSFSTILKLLYIIGAWGDWTTGRSFSLANASAKAQRRLPARSL